jgi:rhamnosyltransferase
MAPVENVVAIVVTYDPKIPRLQTALDALGQQVLHLFIVDNGSKNLNEVRALVANVASRSLIEMGSNQGIGAALNRGVCVALAHAPRWFLTMDQDSVVQEGAIASILEEWQLLPESTKIKTGILALRPQPQRGSIWLTRYVDQLQILGHEANFQERRAVITSGNLIHENAVHLIDFDTELFIDQVDFAFCAKVRAQGFRILQQNKVSMDHQLGDIAETNGKDHPYENAQRFFYIVRNSTYLVIRRKIGLRFFLGQLIVFSGAYLSVNGVRAIPRCIAIIFRGLYDGITRRLGRREYPFLQSP